MTDNKPFEFNGVTYMTKESEKEPFLISNPKKPHAPESLYKYYSVSNLAFKFSVDAFLKHYLFASHPLNLNDKYDCSEDLIDYSKLSSNFFIQKMSKEMALMSEEEIISLYNSTHRRIVINKFAGIYINILYMKFGIISLCEHPDNILMWSYYAQNSGFVIKFRTAMLPKRFYGPFPINYSDKWNKIDLTDNEKIDSLCALYQTNVKNIKWMHENEWRYLTFKSDGKYHPYCGNSNLETNGRKFSYNPESVEEVILGYDFFKISEFVRNECTPEYFIIKIQNCSSQDNWKIRFLNHISQNSIKCSQVKRSRDEYQFDFYNINLERLKNNRFKITNPVLS